MGFVVHWWWYGLAFLAGTAVAWVITVQTVHRTSEQEAIADLPGSREIGAR